MIAWAGVCGARSEAGRGPLHGEVQPSVRAPTEGRRAAFQSTAGAGFSTDSAGRADERSRAAGPDRGKARR